MSLADARPFVRPKGPRPGRGSWKIFENSEQPIDKVGQSKCPYRNREESAPQEVVSEELGKFAQLSVFQMKLITVSHFSSNDIQCISV